MRKYLLRALVPTLFAATALNSACKMPSSEEANVRAPESGALVAIPTPVDSARAGTIALDTLQKLSAWGLAVHKIVTDSAGYLVTVFSDPLIPGGGGIVRVTFAGNATIVK